MANTKGIRRIIGKIYQQADREIPEKCEWYHPCDRRPAYRNTIWTGRQVFTCPSHTPQRYRKNPLSDCGHRYPTACNCGEDD